MKPFVRFFASMLLFFWFLVWMGLGDENAWKLAIVVPFVASLLVVCSPRPAQQR